MQRKINRVKLNLSFVLNIDPTVEKDCQTLVEALPFAANNLNQAFQLCIEPLLEPYFASGVYDTDLIVEVLKESDEDIKEKQTNLED